VGGAHEFVLPAGAKARLELAGSPLAFQVAVVSAGKRLPPEPIDPSTFVFSGMSFLLHVGLIAIFAFFMPSMHGDDSEALDRDQILMMQKLLSAAAEREQTPPPPDEAQASHENEGGSGAQAKGASGTMGTPLTKETGHRYAIQATDNSDPHLANQRLLREAANFGMIGMLASMSGDPNAPIAPWGRPDPSGTDVRSAMGNMFGDTIGDAIGTGGLGTGGNEEGGGGSGEGIGMDGFGDALGHGGGGGPGGGLGHGHGLSGRGHQPKAAPIHEGRSEVNGHLPAEVIQRVVHQNFGRFRLCYETGMRDNPNLTGRVTVKFIIDRSGAVSTALDGGSDLPNQSVVQCVVRGFTNLSFPAPESGMVTVVYPLVFSPSQ
jgi:hypothetical protein